MESFVIAFGAPAQPFGQVCACWIFPCQDAGATWRTDVASRIGVFKQDAFFCKLIDRWRFIELAAIATHIPLTKIIDQKEDNVGLSCGGNRIDASQDANEKEHADCAMQAGSIPALHSRFSAG